MIAHELKCDPEFFDDVWRKRKTFEVRPDDREPRFSGGQELLLREYDRQTKQYSGRCIRVVVGYVLRDERFCKPGMCIFGITIVEKTG